MSIKKFVIVAGGAGYIGSHACKALSLQGYIPVTVDNLSTGWREAVKYGPFERVDLLNFEEVDHVFSKYQPVGVLHFAAKTQVGESVNCPGEYWRNNLVGTLNLVQAAITNNCLNFIFSSTAAVYGDQDNVLLTEANDLFPMNPYGSSKRASEEIIQQFSFSHGLRFVVFRYFNVAGADEDADLGECHKPETHLIPLILDSLDGKREAFTVYGTDYPTSDGTCVRDYVHVCDLVDAHVLGLQWLEAGRQNRFYNLGTGRGFSVKEVISGAEMVTKREVPIRFGERRSGDPASLVSGSELASTELRWKPYRSTLNKMIQDAWRWHNKAGYSK